jgi:hypothetical protein
MWFGGGSFARRYLARTGSYQVISRPNGSGTICAFRDGGGYVNARFWAKLRLDTAIFPVREALSADARLSTQVADRWIEAKTGGVSDCL